MVTAVAYRPSTTVSQASSGPCGSGRCSPQTISTVWCQRQAGTVTVTGLLATTTPSARTSSEPVKTWSSSPQSRSPAQVTSNLTTCSTSPASGPWLGGVIEVTNPPMAPLGTRLRELIVLTAVAMSPDRVVTMAPASMPVVCEPPGAAPAVIRVAWPGVPPIGQTPE